MKIYVLSVILIISTTQFGIAQRVQLFPPEMYSGGFAPLQRNLNYDNIQGSPYVDDDLIKGYVKFSFGDSTVHFLRYNIFADEMEFLDNKQIYTIENVGELDHVYVNGHLFKYSTYKFRNSFNQGYLELLVEGKYTLYLKYNVKFQEKEPAKTPYDKPTPDGFIREASAWYCSLNNGPIKNFQNSNSNLEELFNEDYTAVKNYIKTKKIKLRKEEEMIKVFQYINSAVSN